ncbi:MAG: hypothetical protein KAW51_08615 [Candidatus Lokiarchaeota archaeon]|nr:hypothetical protein [Candidatus Lokiarchaeota archaeon]
MQESTPIDLRSFIKNKIIKDIKKIRGKHAPISEIVLNVSKTLTVEKIYDLSEKDKNCFLFIVKNYSKTPKLRYFLAISLANNSSDFLVQIAKDYAIKNDFKLVQYSIFPRTLRIQLLLIKELKQIEDYKNFLEKSINIRRKFRAKLDNIKNLVELL